MRHSEIWARPQRCSPLHCPTLCQRPRRCRCSHLCHDTAIPAGGELHAYPPGWSGRSGTHVPRGPRVGSIPRRLLQDRRTVAAKANNHGREHQQADRGGPSQPQQHHRLRSMGAKRVRGPPSGDSATTFLYPSREVHSRSLGPKGQHNLLSRRPVHGGRGPTCHH